MTELPLRLLPFGSDADLAIRGAVGAFADVGGLDELQLEVLRSVAAEVYGLDLDAEPPEPLTAQELLDLGVDERTRRHAVHLMVVLELMLDPVPVPVARAVETYAHALDVHLAILRDARELAHHHIALMYADMQRSSWYTEQTVRSSLHGRFLELVRSKIAYTGIAPDAAIAHKWEALADLPEGSWGREVAHFYERHHFPFPGERHGIYEIGARHDFVHVLADYDATPEGELDVFAFIAAAMPDEKGLVLLAVTLGLFQNGAIHHVAGKKVKIARTDTLADPGSAPRWGRAMARGRECTVDVMGGIDHFALAPLPLEEVRRRFSVPPRPTDEAATAST